MSLYASLIRPAAFLLDPELVHEMALRLIKAGLFEQNSFDDERLAQSLCGLTFSNPLGLAAGFDKDAIAVDAWSGLGFGYAEVGTVTPLPQPGNPKPRLFRLKEDEALINRMGFNNSGTASLADHLRGSRPTIPIGVNLGKNKLTLLGDASKDYSKSYTLLHGLGDYFVVNVSSPNTPGLRSLQDKSALSEIALAMLEIDGSKPILIKVAPDLEMTAIDDVLEVIHELKLTGIVATNTTISRPQLNSRVDQEGGLSGKPLKSRSDEVISHIYRHSDPKLVIVGVGGIFNGDDLFRKIGLGAHLCQVYTGFIYGGPSMVAQSLQQLADRLTAEGIRHVSELRGSLASSRV